MGKETEIRTTMLWPSLLVLLDHNQMVWKIPTYTWQCSSSLTGPPASEESGLRGQTEQAGMEARWRARIPQLSHGELKSQREDSLAQRQNTKAKLLPKASWIQGDTCDLPGLGSTTRSLGSAPLLISCCSYSSLQTAGIPFPP